MMAECALCGFDCKKDLVEPPVFPFDGTCTGLALPVNKMQDYDDLLITGIWTESSGGLDITMKK